MRILRRDVMNLKSFHTGTNIASPVSIHWQVKELGVGSCWTHQKRKK